LLPPVLLRSRRAYRAGPTGVARSLYRAWKPEAIFVIVDTYIDESGTHGSSPHLIMGGMVGRLGQWVYFDKLWRKMLRREQIAYYHTKSMKDGDGPFKGWKSDQKVRLVKAAGKIEQKATLFCFSIMVRKDEYLQHYHFEPRPRKVQLDTMYGMCFRYCTIFVSDLVKKTYEEKELTLNFVLEQGAKNYGQAETIFRQMKTENPTLGQMSAEPKTKFPGLQGADYVSHTTYVAELGGAPELTDFPIGGDVGEAKKILGRKSPSFRCHITSGILKDWRKRMFDIEAARIEYGRAKRATIATPSIPA
jgi:Protein of unknown function (DUF3800)